MATKRDVEEQIEPKRGQKPGMLFIEAFAADRALHDSDCLSIEGTIFANGGSGKGGKAVPFVELTPELLAWLRAQTWGQQ